jgi:hypothetical protein
MEEYDDFHAYRREEVDVSGKNSQLRSPHLYDFPLLGLSLTFGEVSSRPVGDMVCLWHETRTRGTSRACMIFRLQNDEIPVLYV